MEETVMKTRKIKIADSYFALIHQFPLRPIRDDAEYDAAVAVMEKLAVRSEKSLDNGERDYLDALDEFISAFDRKQFERADIGTPLERLKYILAESETSPTGLKNILGCSQALVSMVLGGERELSKDNIRLLCAYFHLEPSYFF
jgi:HTH-type transcriptional regulator / antitoxin HigA